MKLQVGSSEVKGIYKRAEWINIDLQDVSNDGVNVIGSGFELPFADNSFEEVHCIHVLEHVTRDKYPVMLSEMCRVIKPKSFAYVETPDWEGVVDNLHSAFCARDINAIHVWTTSTYGKSERTGMAHHWGFYEELLESAMIKAGFSKAIRWYTMISNHHIQEPVLLMRGTK